MKPAPASLHVDAAPRQRAPDGSRVDVLLRLERGSMARFSLPAGHTSAAVVHRTMDELWYVLAGRGEMWRSHDGQETTICLLPGLSLSLPAGTHFQFRAAPDTELAILGVSMPPWPGDHEALAVAGPWPPSAAPYP